MATESLKSGGESLTHSTMKVVDVDTGSHGLMSTYETGEAIKSIDDGSPVGSSRPAKHYHLFTVQRDGSPPSGYAADGTADYGDGQSSVVFDYDDDDQNAFGYFRPLAPESGSY